MKVVNELELQGSYNPHRVEHGDFMQIMAGKHCCMNFIIGQPTVTEKWQKRLTSQFDSGAL